MEWNERKELKDGILSSPRQNRKGWEIKKQKETDRDLIKTEEKM